MKAKYDAKEKEVEEWKQRAHQLNEKLESKSRQVAKLQVSRNVAHDNTDCLSMAYLQQAG
jgi:hypothetical protein